MSFDPSKSLLFFLLLRLEDPSLGCPKDPCAVFRGGERTPGTRWFERYLCNHTSHIPSGRSEFSKHPRNVRRLSPGGKLSGGYWMPSTPTMTRVPLPKWSWWQCMYRMESSCTVTACSQLAFCDGCPAEHLFRVDVPPSIRLLGVHFSTIWVPHCIKCQGRIILTSCTWWRLRYPGSGDDQSACTTCTLFLPGIKQIDFFIL